MATFKQYKKKNGDKAWMFQVYAGINPMTGRKRNTTRRGFRTQAEAKAAAKKLEAQLQEESAQATETINYSFKEIYKLWYSQYKLTVKETTAASTKLYFRKHILPEFGDYYISAIDPIFCQKVIDKWATNSPGMVRLFRAYTKQVFDFAIALPNAKIDNNPLYAIKAPRKEEKIKDEDEIFYTKQELLAFLESAKELLNYKQYTFFRLLAYSGLRKSEATALTWDDVNLAKRSLRVNKTVTRDINWQAKIDVPKTKTSVRTISLDDETTLILKKWQYRQKVEFFENGIPMTDPQLVFPNFQNELVSFPATTHWLDDFHSRYKEKHGKAFKRITLHGFRHTHASLLFEAGASIKEVQVRLGHSDIQTTMNVYNHVTKARADASGKRFADYMSE